MRLATLFLLVTAALASFAFPAQEASEPAMKKSTGCELRMAMRKLWEEHITYTRNYIISALADLPDAGAVGTRLLKNQDDLGAAFRPYYGVEAEKKLSQLLRDHILIAVEVVGAAKAGEPERLTRQQERWSENGRDIAAFLSGANPAWPKKTLADALQKHLDMTTAEVVSRLKKDWAADIKAYDEGHEHMLMFSDLLTDGLMKQFPTRLTE